MDARGRVRHDAAAHRVTVPPSVLRSVPPSVPQPTRQSVVHGAGTLHGNAGVRRLGGVVQAAALTSGVESTRALPELADRHPPGRLARVAGTNALAWGAVILLHAAASYGDQLRRDGSIAFAPIVRAMALAYLPWLTYSLVLSLLLARQPSRVTERGAMLRLFLWSIPLFLLPQVAYQVLLVSLAQPAHPGDVLASFTTAFRRWPAMLWLIDVALFSATYAVVHATFATLETHAAQRRRDRADAEVRAMRHELDQQRLQGLRAQLEPHFLFNTLNAISGLVRGDDRSLAVKALGELSALLRHALSSIQRDWVTMEDELTLVTQYLALQRLRYGERLHVTEAVGEGALEAECPPFLLQPLVENAIRHDLERHEGTSDIHLRVARVDQTVTVEVSNGLRPALPPNPGAGLGLRATRDRLQLLYGARARLETRQEGERFVVHVELPVHARD